MVDLMDDEDIYRNKGGLAFWHFCEFGENHA